MPTIVKHAIRATIEWDANQAAMEALYGVDGYYTTITAWEAAQQRDLVAVDEVAVLELYKDDFTPHGGAVSQLNEGDIKIDGWTTSEANHIDIHAASGEEHSGTVADSFIVKFSADYRELEIYEWNVKFKGFALNLGGRKSYGFFMKQTTNAATGEFLEFDSCIAFNANKSGPSYGFSITRQGTLSTKITNCLAYDVQYGVFVNNWTTVVAKNLTVTNCTVGLRLGDSNTGTSKQTIENVVCAFNGTDFAFGGNTAGQFATNCASSDATVLNASNKTDCITGIIATDFIDEANDDYHLSATSQLIDQGVDLSVDFTTDADGDTRTAPWDIGFDEYVAAGGTSAALASNAIANATANAAATTGIPIAGATLSVATGSGVISTSIDLGGALSAIAVLNGNIDTQIKVSVAAIAEALTQAGLDTQTLFEAVATGQADSSGTLSGTGADLSGAANALADSNATISVAITMQGTALSQALATAGLTAPGSGLSGAATAQASSGGAISTDIPLLGNGSAIVTAQGGIDTILQMQGAAASASNMVGGLTTEITFNGNALIQALAQSALTTADGLSGDAGAVADSTGWLKIGVTFEGDAVGEALAVGNLSSSSIDIPTTPRWAVIAAARNFRINDKRTWHIYA